MDDIKEGLLCVLECPCCKQYMLPPITSCENGHSICQGCKIVLKSCITCKQPFLNLPNLALESLAQTSKFPCNRRTYGCKEMLSLKALTTHQNSCPYGDFIRCPYNVLPPYNCIWNGTVMEGFHHVNYVHGSKILFQNPIFDMPIPDLCEKIYHHQFICTHDELFLCSWAMPDGNIYFATYYVGPNSKAHQFTYLVEACKEGSGNLLYRTGCRVRNLDESNDYSRECDYAILPFETLNNVFHFEETMRLTYTIKICPVK